MNIIIYFIGRCIKVKKTISPILAIGLIIFIILNIIERFIITLSDWISIPILILAIVLIIIGGLKKKD